MIKYTSKSLLFLVITALVFSSYAQSTLAPLPTSKNKFVVISHRGNHVNVPENSLASYEEAIKSGADYTEIDVRTSKDGVLVIHHDGTLDRMTNATGNVKDKTLAELSQLQLKSPKAGDATVYRIPTFREVLKVCKNRINIYLDFKEADVAETWKQIQEEGMEKQIVVYLNKIPYYKQWRSIAPQMPLMTSLPEEIKNSQQLKFFLGQAKIEVLDNIGEQAMGQTAQEEGTAVWLDVQSPSEGKDAWDSALNKGVQGVQTDNPEALVNYLKTNGWRDGIAKNAVNVPKKPAYQSLMDVSYGYAENDENKFDAYIPENHTPDTKVIVYIHGGSWSRGDKSEFPKQLIDELVGKKGYIVVSMNYRLVKDGKNLFPAQIQDVKKVIAFLSAQSKRYRYNGNEFALMGGSAGAHLAMLYAYAHDPYKQVKTVVNLWGPTDLTDKSVRADGSDANNTVIRFLGEADPKAKICVDASPLLHLTKETAVPTISFHGVEDPLVNVSQAENLHKKLQSLGVLTQLELYPHEKHGMSASAAVDVFDKMVKWLDKQYPAK
ncbi:glycerophosphodiester phosphodiesterase family protein [Runella sp.]|uniref:glycerophosphodiester phosphodiesterase family protein n=1 Tax=Runella sp. TaxID=1960881 RepID=UPI003D0A29BA